MKKRFLLIIMIVCPGCISCGGVVEKIQTKLDANKSTTVEYTIEDWKAQGVITEHLFSFDDCSMTYNGSPFMIGEPMTDIFELFGKPDRKEETSLGHLYFWDNSGFSARGERWDLGDDSSLEILAGFEVAFNLNLSGYEEEDVANNEFKKRTREQMISNNPLVFFEGKILVHGIPLGRGISIKEFLKENTRDWDNPFFPRLYKHQLRLCNYEVINIPHDQVLNYTIYVSDDYSDIEFFMIGTQYYLLR